MSASDRDAPAEADLEHVTTHLDRIRQRRRGNIRWSMGKHTAELAINALAKRGSVLRPSSKSRRRKRYKRLL